MKIGSWVDVERALRLLEDKLTKFTKGAIPFDPHRYYTRNEIDKKISTSVEEGDIDSILQGGNVLHFLSHIFKKSLTALSAVIQTTLNVQGAVDLDSTLNVDGATTLSSLTASRPLKLDGSKIITASQINLASGNDVTGTLPVGNGGTGATSFTANAVLLGNGAGAFQVEVGVSGQIQLTVTKTTLNYKDHAGANQSLEVVTGVTLTANNFTNGVRTT